MPPTLKSFVIASALISLQGCANLNSVYRHNHLSKPGQTEFVDAKQRAIVAAPVEVWKEVVDPNADKRIINHHKTMYRICSEPAPDVFSAYAFSGSAKAEKSATGVGGQLGMSSAETAATIQRTQTINLMRESMFRTCERYMNGALDPQQMNIQTARDQRMMVATLAIEQLTGVVKTKPTVLSAKAAGVVAANASENIKKYEESRKATETAKTALKTKEDAKKTADKTWTDLNTKAAGKEDEPGVCEKILTPPDGFTPPGTPKKEDCQAAKDKKDASDSAVTSAKADVTKAEKHEAIITNLVQQASGLSFTAEGQLLSSDAGSDRASETHLQAVADTVKVIALAAFSDKSEILFACQKMITAGQLPQGDSFRQVCEDIFVANFTIEAQLASGISPNFANTASYLQRLGASNADSNRYETKAMMMAEQLKNLDIQSCVTEKADQLTSSEIIRNAGFVTTGTKDILKADELIAQVTKRPPEPSELMDEVLEICNTEEW